MMQMHHTGPCIQLQEAREEAAVVQLMTAETTISKVSVIRYGALPASSAKIARSSILAPNNEGRQASVKSPNADGARSRKRGFPFRQKAAREPPSNN